MIPSMQKIRIGKNCQAAIRIMIVAVPTKVMEPVARLSASSEPDGSCSKCELGILIVDSLPLAGVGHGRVDVRSVEKVGVTGMRAM
ncbi:MAG: hypothetical protein K0S36_2275 [Nitrosospira multiformis]|nr:hypothetical protein [Nitrosospira multiformis]